MDKGMGVPGDNPAEPGHKEGTGGGRAPVEGSRTES